MILAILIIALAVNVTSSVAPWWAGPVYVAAIERILIAWGQALIVALVPVSATVVRGIKSHREHKQNLAAVEAALVDRDVIKTAIEQVHQEVKTANALSVGQMADAGESRRIEEKRPADRTEAEQGHLDAVPSPLPPTK